MTSDLTPRERQVFELAQSGLSYKEIASKLNVSVQTVKNYSHFIRIKLGMVHEKGFLREFPTELA